jgi:hypothetical protein
MKCRYTTVGSGNEGHPCSRNAVKFGLCSVHMQVEYGHFYGGYRAKRKSDTCLNCGEPRSDTPVDFYCRAKPAARALIGGTGRMRSFVLTGPKEKDDEPYKPAQPERANRSFQSKVRVIKAQDRRPTGAE